jgi:hypothetical protein
LQRWMFDIGGDFKELDDKFPGITQLGVSK